MRNIEIIIFLLATLTPLSVTAEPSEEPLPPSSVKVSGAFRLRPQYFSHPDFLNDRSDVLLRLRPDVLWTPSIEVSVFLQPQAAKSFGEPAYVPADTTNRTSDSSASSNTDTSPITFHQAYADYTPWDWFTVRMGRQVLSYGEETVIGAADWANVGRTFDAIRIFTRHAYGASDFFTSKIKDTNISASGPGDKDVHGMYNTFEFGTWLNRAEFYVIDIRDATASGVHPTTLVATGVRLKSAVGPFDYRVEGTRERGFSTNSGSQANADVGFTLRSSDHKPRIAVEYSEASKDFNQLFPSAHRYLGMGDELARRNVRGYAVHGSGKIVRGLDFRLDYFEFQRVDVKGPMYRLDGVSALGSATKSNSTDVGREVNAWLKYQANARTSWSAGFSKFYSGQYVKDQFNKKNPEFGYVQFETMF